MGSTMSIYRSTKIMTLAGCALQLLVVEAGQTGQARGKPSRRRLAGFQGDLYDYYDTTSAIKAREAARGSQSPASKPKEGGQFPTGVESRSTTASPMEVGFGDTPDGTPTNENMPKHGFISRSRPGSPTNPGENRPMAQRPARSPRSSGTKPRSRRTSSRSSQRSRRSTSTPQPPRKVIDQARRATNGAPSRFTGRAPSHVARPAPRARSSQATQTAPRSPSRGSSRSSTRPNPWSGFEKSFKPVPIHYSPRATSRSSTPKPTNVTTNEVDWAGVVRKLEHETEILEAQNEVRDLEIEIRELQAKLDKDASRRDLKAQIKALKDRIRQRKSNIGSLEDNHETTRKRVEQQKAKVRHLTLIARIVRELESRYMRGNTKSLKDHFLKLSLPKRSEFLKGFSCQDCQYFIDCLEEAQKKFDQTS